MNPVAENLLLIRERITKACAAAGRNTGDVKLLLATKTVPAEKIRAALEAGETYMGENKVQELAEKAEALQTIPHHKHFIGHLQSNKISLVLKYADCIQSVDRLSLAQKLQTRLEFEDRAMDVFLQVNTSYEQSKFGIAPEHALAFALQVQQFERIRIKGLMTIGLFSAETGQVRKCYRLLKNLQLEMTARGIPVHELSMGMSGDFEIAIEEGATMIRTGTAVFGSRIHPDSYYWNENK